MLFGKNLALLLGTSVLTPWQDGPRLMSAEGDPEAGGGSGGADDDAPPAKTGGQGLLADLEDDEPPPDDKTKVPPKDEPPKVFKTKIGEADYDVPAQFWDAKANDGKGAINQAALLKSFNDTKAAHDRLATQIKNGVVGTMPEKAADYLTADVLKDGVFKRPDGVVKLSDIKADEPALVKWTEIAHKHKLTAEQFHGIISDTMILADGFSDEPYDADKEMAKLGGADVAKPAMRTIKSWLGGLHQAEALTAEEYAFAVAIGKTAVGVQTLNKLRAQTGQKIIPLNTTEHVQDELPTKDQWYASKPDHRKEPDAYAKWQQQGEALFGTGAAGTSQAGLGVPASTGAVGLRDDDNEGPKNTRTRLGGGNRRGR